MRHLTSWLISFAIYTAGTDVVGHAFGLKTAQVPEEGKGRDKKAGKVEKTRMSEPLRNQLGFPEKRNAEEGPSCDGGNTKSLKCTKYSHDIR